MLILAFDTTSELGGAAIYLDEECLASVANPGPANIYSVTLFQMVDRLIAEARTKADGPLKGMSDIELYAVATGPGSFTGIRVGLAAAKAWAKAFSRPVKGVSVLEALVEDAQPETDVAIPILDAHRGEFYLARFRRIASPQGSRFVAEGEGRVLKPEAVKEYFLTSAIHGAPATCIVRSNDEPARALSTSLPGNLSWRNVSGTLVRAIAQIGGRSAREGKLQSASELDAFYLRRSDAELNWKD